MPDITRSQDRHRQLNRVNKRDRHCIPKSENTNVLFGFNDMTEFESKYPALITMPARFADYTQLQNLAVTGAVFRNRKREHENKLLSSSKLERPKDRRWNDSL